jgi:hypothetical protein
LSRAANALECLLGARNMGMVNVLLNAGATGVEVDKALSRALKDGNQSEQNYKLIESLVRGGADVNVYEGACLTLPSPDRISRHWSYFLKTI